MNIPQPLAGHVRVNFGRADVSMAEHFLDDAQVGAIFQKVRREAVTQHVRSDVAGDAGVFHAAFYALPHRDRRERRAALS